MRALNACAAACLAAASLLPTPWSASAAEPQRQQGVYLRWTSGMGSTSASTDVDGETLKLSGLGGDGELAIGRAVGNKCAHVTLWGWRVNDPVGAFGDVSDHIQGVVSMGAVGPGFTYLMQRHFYVSGSVGVGRITLHVDGDDAKHSTKPGIATQWLVGKEWPVSPSWGVGLAGGFSYCRAKDQDRDNLFDADLNWSALGYSLRFSATHD